MQNVSLEIVRRRKTKQKINEKITCCQRNREKGNQKVNGKNDKLLLTRGK